jgi:archaellum biogenesis ATPase FlaH
MSVLQTALAYAKQDIRVIPIKQGEKRPPMQGWQNAATSDPITIRTWFEGQFKDCGLGIATGEFRNRYLVVIDIDDRPEFSGSDTLKDLEQLHGELPNTVEVITGSGGRHIYFLTDQPIRNEASGKLGQGIDVRGIGGQVLAPPTVHPNGRTYEWVEGKSIANTPPADMPLWMVLILTEKQTDDIPMTYESTTNILTEEGPASRYCAATTWPELLRQDGWTQAHTDRSGETHWVRPGKDIREGTSATTGWQGKDILKVFTTSITGLPAGAYTRFGYTAAMHHNGDRSAFAKKLLQEGNALIPVEQPTKTDNILINWQEFWTQSFPEEDWLIKPLIPRNQLVVIFAPGGTGKSLLALYIAAGLATGRNIFGIEHQPISVLYMDYEMQQAQLYERLTAMGYNKDTDLTRLHYASLPPIASLDTPEGAKEVCDLARACQAELVIIDTFSRAVEGAENDADTVRNFYRWTALKLKTEGRSLLRIDHAGKDLKKGARGTSAKNDDVDLVWQMTRAGDEVRLVPTKKRHTWINPVDLQVRKTEEMFIQNIKGGPRLDKAIEIINREKINVHVGQKIFWKQFEPHAGVGEGRVSQQMAWLAQQQLKEQTGLIDYTQEEF